MAGANFDTSLADDIYEGNNNDGKIYMSFLKKNYVNNMILDFRYIEDSPDRNYNNNPNLKVACTIIDALTKTDKLQNIDTYLVAPQITFWKMFKNYGIDVRDHIRQELSIHIKFRVISRRCYELKYCKTIRNPDDFNIPL